MPADAASIRCCFRHLEALPAARLFFWSVTALKLEINKGVNLGSGYLNEYPNHNRHSN